MQLPMAITLDSIGRKYGTDKSSAHHNYLVTYEKYFAPLRHQPIKLLEIGAGGYEHPDRGGQSLHMWSEYFPQGTISCVELYDKSKLKLPARTKIYQGSQDNGTFLNGLLEKLGQQDIIIDDGSHINALTIASFDILFPWVKSGGIYIVEDAHTSYWKENYGGTTDLRAVPKSSTMNYFKYLCDTLNGAYLNSTTGCYISSIHFYTQLIIIIKK